MCVTSFCQFLQVSKIPGPPYIRKVSTNLACAVEISDLQTFALWVHKSSFDFITERLRSLEINLKVQVVYRLRE
jgi:hypothetical protein